MAEILFSRTTYQYCKESQASKLLVYLYIDNCVYSYDSYNAKPIVTIFLLARLVVVLLLNKNSFKQIGVLVTGHVEIRHILKSTYV